MTALNNYNMNQYQDNVMASLEDSLRDPSHKNQLQLQRDVQRMQQQVQTLSNVMAAIHKTSMAIIGNIH